VSKALNIVRIPELLRKALRLSMAWVSVLLQWPFARVMRVHFSKILKSLKIKMFVIVFLGHSIAIRLHLLLVTDKCILVKNSSFKFVVRLVF
jgi:hypothetical protein